jgi:phage terminase Nu1 subunit (DNA packaging protein)
MTVDPDSPALSPLRIATKGQCAEFFGVSIQTIAAWARRGMPVIAKGGTGGAWQIDLLEVCKWRFGVNAHTVATDPESLDPVQRRAWYEGEVKRWDLQVRARELIPVAEVEQVVATAFAAVASGMRSIPDNLERKHGIAADVAERVEAFLNEAMDAMADRLSVLGLDSEALPPAEEPATT